MRRQRMLLLFIGVIALLGVVGAAAQGILTLDWFTADGGGGTWSEGGGFTLGGTVGQPDAGALSGGAYTLLGGFWAGSGPNPYAYLPVILR